MLTAKIFKLFTSLILVVVGCTGSAFCWIFRRKTKAAIKSTSQRKRFRVKSAHTELKSLLLLIAMTNFLIIFAQAKVSDIRVIDAMEEECMNDREGLVSCKFNNVTTFNLRPTPQTLTMVLKDHVQRPIGTLSLKLGYPEPIRYPSVLL